MTGSADTRDLRDRWERLGDSPTMSTMLLNAAPNVEELEAQDRAEVLSILPDLQDLTILDLGAGIGRFTRHFVRHARHVLAVDMVEAFIEENRRNNGAKGNAEFRCAEIGELDLPRAGYDLVFTNWLLMYLEDEAVAPLLDSIRAWLKPGGHLFVRESCHHSSIEGSVASPEAYQAVIDATNYRHPDAYRDHFDGRFDVVRHGNIVAYVRYYQNRNQLYWLLARPAD